MKYIKSPLYYNGNKFELIGVLKETIPKNSNGTFYDIFGGSGVVSLNFAKHYNKVVYNDKEKYVFDMFKWALSINSQEKINELKEYMLNMDKKYGLFSDEKITGNLKENIFYKNYKNFILKEKITNKSSPELLFLVSCISFSQTLRFNSNGELNISWGGDAKWKENNLEDFKNCFNINNIETMNKSFEEFNDFNENDFVYLDPPYFGTDAVYNASWGYAQEAILQRFCERLNRNNVKFALSNIFKNKHFVNQQLIDWVKENKFFVKKMEHQYHFKGTSNKVIEVIICNYDYRKLEGYTEQMKLF